MKDTGAASLVATPSTVADSSSEGAVGGGDAAFSSGCVLIFFVLGAAGTSVPCSAAGSCEIFLRFDDILNMCVDRVKMAGLAAFLVSSVSVV